MKKLLRSFLMTLLLLTSLALPSSLSAQETQDLSIGIFQFVSHPALDDITQGVLQAFEEAGYIEGENLEVNFQNAEGDMNLLQQIASQMVDQEPDLLVAVATPPAIALQQETEEIPIILGAITDPVSTKLVDSMEAPGANITGVSDMAPLEEQIDLIEDLFPEAQTIGMIYSDSEPNSKSEVEAAKAEAEARGLEVQVQTIASTLDMQLAAETLASQVDVIFIPTDNTIASSIETLYDITYQHDIPVIPTVDTMMVSGGVAAISINQKDMGLQAGQMALEILEGQDPATFPVQTPRKILGIYNQEAIDELGLDIPEDLLEELTEMHQVPGLVEN